MSKYNLELKLSVVRHYQLGVDGQGATARLFDINKSSLQKRVSAYKHHGLDGLTHRSTSYTAAFKESVIRYKRQQRLSFLDAAILFKIPSPSTIYVWEKRYDKKGIQALITKRGRKNRMSNPSKPSSGKPIDEMSKEELLAE